MLLIRRHLVVASCALHVLHTRRSPTPTRSEKLRWPVEIVTFILLVMTLDNILASIDAEIARLMNVRDLLTEVTTKASEGSNGATPRKRRKLSPASRKRIADAQRKRWAKQKAVE